MAKNNAIVLCYDPSLSSKYWKSLFQPLKKIFQSPILFAEKSFKEELKMEHLISWGETNYPNCKIVYFHEKYFGMSNKLFSGYADKMISLVKIQPDLTVPIGCRSNKLVKVPWYRVTLVVAIHEIAHMFGLNHCSNPKCVMAKLPCKRNSGYCWPCIARRSKFYRSKIFCNECYAKLRSSEISTSDQFT